MAESDVSIRLKVEGVETIEGLRKAIKDANKALSQLPTENKAAIDALGKQIAATKDYVAGLTATTLSSNAKMKESYFVFGEEIRRKTLPAMTSLVQVIQDAPYGIRGMGNNIDYLVQQMVHLRTSGMGASQMIAGMVGTLAGPMGIMAGVSVVTALATVFSDKLFPSVKKSTAEIKDFHSIFKIIEDRIAKNAEDSEDIKLLVARRNRLQSMISGAGGINSAMNAALRNDKTNGSGNSLIDNVLADIGLSKGGAVDTIGYLQRLNAELKAINDELDKLGYNKKKNNTKDDAAKDDAAFEVQLYDAMLAEEEKQGEEFNARKRSMQEAYFKWYRDTLNKALDAETEKRIEAEKKIQDEIKRGQALTSVLMSGFNAVGNAIQRDIHDKLVDAFNGADSLAQKFVVGLIDGIASIAMELASKAIVSGFLSLAFGAGFGGIFNALTGGLSSSLGVKPNANGGWIPEPVLGVGRSGQMYTFGERGPEYVHSNSNLRSVMNERHSGGRNDVAIIRAINSINARVSVSSSKFSVMVEGGKRIRNPRSY